MTRALAVIIMLLIVTVLIYNRTGRHATRNAASRATTSYPAMIHGA